VPRRVVCNMSVLFHSALLVGQSHCRCLSVQFSLRCSPARPSLTPCWGGTVRTVVARENFREFSSSESASSRHPNRKKENEQSSIGCAAHHHGQRTNDDDAKFILTRQQPSIQSSHGLMLPRGAETVGRDSNRDSAFRRTGTRIN